VSEEGTKAIRALGTRGTMSITWWGLLDHFYIPFLSLRPEGDEGSGTLSLADKAGGIPLLTWCSHPAAAFYHHSTLGSRLLFAPHARHTRRCKECAVVKSLIESPRKLGFIS